jgi:signal transduction histidine kinase
LTQEPENEDKRMTDLLNETGRIAKIGGWELDIATNELTWTDKTFRILEVEKKNNQKPVLTEGLALFTPSSAPIIDRAVKRAIEHGEPYNLELEALTAKGKKLWVQTNGRANFKDGKIVSIFGTIQDISEGKAKENEYKFLLDTAGFGLWNFDPVSQSLEWDRKMYEIFEIDSNEFSGAFSAWENSLTTSSKLQATEELELALSGKKEFNTEFEIMTKKGRIKRIAGRGMVVRNEKNEPIKMLGFNWDVTDRIEKENLLKAAQMKVIQSSKLASLGEMSAAIAHEINNPLAIIKSNAQLLEEQINQGSSQLSKKINSILNSCERIGKIVNGLQKFSRSGEVTKYKKLPLESIVKESINLVSVKAKLNHVTVTVECKSQSQILCNEIEIEQVLINLIGNAIDAAKSQPEKWVKISIYDNDADVIAEIQDSGTGIPAHIQEKIFEPFYTTKPVGEGTGLGLSITKGILDEHHATILLVPNALNTCFQVKFKKN